MTKQEHQQILIRRLVAEVESGVDDVELPIILTPQAALCVVANLQLALRHPGNQGDTARIARTLINGIIGLLRDAGLPAHAELAEAGNDFANDDMRLVT